VSQSIPEAVRGSLYFHSPCFDGIASAVVALDFLSARYGWHDTHLHPVNYELKGRWLESPLQPAAAVVDFLYHPTATFWVDHHSTTFLTPGARADFLKRRGPFIVYDQVAGSCAGLLRRHLDLCFAHSRPRLAELVNWAEKTDAAEYDSVEEAVFGDAPALRISLSLSAENSPNYSSFLVRELLTRSLQAVADDDEVKRRYALVRSRVDEGNDRLREHVHIEDGAIAVFDVDATAAMVSRYAPYLFFPRARYSAGIVRTVDGAKITTMRNPWISFESVPLGPLCAELGGGGHHRVGSIALTGSDVAKAPEILHRVVLEIRRRDREMTGQMPVAASGR
jgi:hypothetical protein